MIAIWYVALAALLFVGIKFSKKKEWNDGNMSFDQTKCFLGFCAVIICFHHMAQVTCAPWLNPVFIRKGLDIFVTAGYPMVGMFLFCSGFGLYKSAKTKPDFFKRFIPVRIIPILIPTILTELVYVYFRHLRHLPIRFKNPFMTGNHDTVHPFIWYIPCILLLYILFYVGFGLFKNQKRLGRNTYGRIRFRCMDILLHQIRLRHMVVQHCPHVPFGNPCFKIREKVFRELQKTLRIKTDHHHSSCCRFMASC